MQQAKGERIVLAGDAGGTKVNLSIFKITDTEAQTLKSKQYHSKNYGSLTDILIDFLSANDAPKPESFCAGVAGPVVNNDAVMTNLSWVIKSSEISERTGIKKVNLLNDLEANAYGLAVLKDEDFVTLHEGSPVKGNAAIIAPGTGLGEAGLFWDGSFYRPFATEGGHCDFAARTQLDIELLEYLKPIHGIVSWEHCVAGPGIFSIYKFFRDVKKMEEPAWLAEEMQKEDPSVAISEAALQNKCEICVAAMNLFVEYIARICTIIGLKMKATGGIFLGGGIPPKIVKLLQQDFFYETFITCDKQKNLVSLMPIKVVMNEATAMLGAAYYAAYGS
jgi:glucokinase